MDKSPGMNGLVGEVVIVGLYVGEAEGVDDGDILGLSEGDILGENVGI